MNIIVDKYILVHLAIKKH